MEALLQDINAIEKQLDQVLSNTQISIEDLAIVVVDYLMDNEATFQMMCYFLTSGAVEPEALKKFNMIQEYFLKMFNVKLKTRGRLSSDIFFAHAFFASITGVVLTFLHYPGVNKEEKRGYMHKLALAIIKEGGQVVSGA